MTDSIARPSTFAGALAAAAMLAASFTSAPAMAQKLIVKENIPLPLTWTHKEQLARYPAMEKIYAADTVKRGTTVHELPAGAPINPKVKWKGKTYSVDDFMKMWGMTGVIALKDGKVRLEKYRDQKPDDRWTSFSVAKSVTSTLIGAAIKDGLIRSEYDQLVRYLPELKGTAYDGVSLRQVMTMTSGVKWNEDYTDPKSDVALSSMVAYKGDGEDPLIPYMAKLPREAEPGTKWVYKTGETDLAGLALERALLGKTLAQYASEKLWAPYGMEKDALWLTDVAGHDRGGCCMSITLRDYARIGEFMRGGGMINGKQILPDGWVEKATTDRLTPSAHDKKVPTGYGFFWWPGQAPNYGARGIFGQSIDIMPDDGVVIAINAAMKKASDPTQVEARAALVKTLHDAAMAAK